MHMPNFGQVMLEGVIWDILKTLFWAAVMTAAIQLILARALHVIKAKREIISLWIGGVVLFSALIYSLGMRAQQPYLDGKIVQGMSGPVPGSERDSIAVIALNITNTGSMQSIVQGWKVQAIVGNNTYDAVFIQMPPSFTFNNIPRTSLNQPTAITFHAQDNIVERALTPIAVGALLPGILFVEFSNVDQSVFRGSVIYKVTYQDVLGRSYSAQATSNGQIGPISVPAGIHSELACPAPQTVTGSLPKLTPPLSTPVPTQH